MRPRTGTLCPWAIAHDLTCRMLAAADGAPWPVSPDLPGVAGVVLYHAGRLLQVTGAKLLLMGFPIQCESDGLFSLSAWVGTCHIPGSLPAFLFFFPAAGHDSGWPAGCHDTPAGGSLVAADAAIPDRASGGVRVEPSADDHASARARPQPGGPLGRDRGDSDAGGRGAGGLVR